jgi:large subunit ribosomal protein L25
MIVDWQREPLKDQLIHIDLKRIALDKALRVSVRVKLLGIPVGVKAAAASWTRCCAKSRSSACPPTFPATLTWM